MRRAPHKTLVVTSFAAVAIVACTVSPSALERGAGRDDPSSPGTEIVTGPNGNPVETTATGLPCDVDKVLKTRCQTCHSAETKYGASAPLVTHADLQKSGPGASAGKKIYELVSERIKDEARPMPPSPNPLLTADELATLDGWIKAGAKASSDTCTSERAGDGVKPLSCKPDTTLVAGAKFTMQPGAPLDQYVCFGVDINLPAKRHVTALAPKVDNTKILHHILLFQAPKSEPSTPTACSAFGSAAWKLVAGWAPGGNNLELPPEAGFPEEKGVTHWVLQLHYNNALNLPGQTDQSGYDLCTTENLRPNDAGVVAFGSTRFNIPPRATHAIRCDYTLPSTFNGVKLFNASPHMHTRGSAMSTHRLPGGTGAPEKIFEMPNFNFENQANFPITASVAPGDVMRTRCTWKNPGDATIGFGEGTGDEMCFDFIGYYPNIPDRTIFGLPLFTWITPSQSASCTVE
ncbi:MAG: peptidylglycine alpha-amidating monooxygenase [Labilithrix sp.]|nr:peptidylglycine alpha-amidating monooxygenase [Labilithrix sp.]